LVLNTRPGRTVTTTTAGHGLTDAIPFGRTASRSHGSRRSTSTCPGTASGARSPSACSAGSRSSPWCRCGTAPRPATAGPHLLRPAPGDQPAVQPPLRRATGGGAGAPGAEMPKSLSGMRTTSFPGMLLCRKPLPPCRAPSSSIVGTIDVGSRARAGSTSGLFGQPRTRQAPSRRRCHRWK
jgi:hypothetical protein